jgi:hypothetical protein
VLPPFPRQQFYEFLTNKQGIAEAAAPFKAKGWQVAVGGLVGKPRVFDLDDYRTVWLPWPLFPNLKRGFMASGIAMVQKNLAAYRGDISRTVSMVMALLDNPNPSKSLGLSRPQPEAGRKVRRLR